MGPKNSRQVRPAGNDETRVMVAQGMRDTQCSMLYPSLAAERRAESKDSRTCFRWLSRNPWTKYFACQILTE
jgi:hypothetical protein